MFPDTGIEIQSVYLPTALHPVLNEEELSPLFTTSNIPLWSVDGGVNPCTINLAKCNDQQIFVKIQWPGSTAECPIRLRGQLESGDQFSQNDRFIMPAAQQSVVVPTKLTAGWSTVVPWGINSTITWTLESDSTEGKVNPVLSHPIQIYAVSARLPPFLSYPGIPQEVLDFFLLTTCKPGCVTTFPEYVTHVVKRVHAEAGSRYERSVGAQNFTDITTSSGTSDLDISKWVVDLRARRTSPSVPQYYTVNCYDQGAIAQLGLILGIQTPEEETKVRWHYLHPFGYIRTLNLVGWKDSNNPFLPGDLVVKPDAENRSNFGNHVFLSYDWKVLDATAGPATGTQSIQEYLHASVDDDAKLYTGDYIKGDTKKDKEKREALRLKYPGQDCPTGGLPSDVINGHGLNTLSTGLSQKDHLPWTVKEFLTSNGLPHSGQPEDPSRPGQDGYKYNVDNLSDALKAIEVTHGGESVTLHFGKAINTAGPTDAQWTWSTKPGPPRVDLHISIFAASELAMMACEQYLSGVTQKLPDALIVDNHIAVESSLHLVGARNSGMGFHLWVAGGLFVVLKGLATNYELHPIIDKINEHKVKHTPIFEAVTMKDLHFNLNGIEKLRIPIKDALNYSVRYTTGNVLVVKADYDKTEENFNFQFLGRQCGLDIVTLTIGNKLGDQKSYHVSFVIKDDTGSVVPRPDPAGSMTETGPKYTTTDSVGNRFIGKAFWGLGDIKDGLKDNITAMRMSVTKGGIQSIQPLYSKSPASPEADDELFVLEADDFITIVTGGVTEDDVLQWIQFYTNKGHKSPVFGNEDEGTLFSWSGPKLMAFSGRGGEVVNALRAHWLNPDSTSPSIKEIATVANSHSDVVGGDRGNMLGSDARLVVDLAGRHLTAISVRFKSTGSGPRPLSAIVASNAQYGDVYGKTLGGFGNGEDEYRKADFTLNTDEWIVGITVYTKTLHLDNRDLEFITRIQFHTNEGRSSSEYGNEPGGKSFTLSGDRLVYLSGNLVYGVVALQAHWLNANPTGGRDEFVE